MEILVEIIGFILIEIIFAGIGWLCLYVWYRNKKKMEEIRNKEYAGAYSAVGKVMLLNLIAGVGAIAMFGVVVFSLGYWIYTSIMN